jgi:hypothetical protein
MDSIDYYVATQDAKEQLYRLSVENLYLKEMIKNLQDQLTTVSCTCSAIKS